jgi:hypothetical protein
LPRAIADTDHEEVLMRGAPRWVCVFLFLAMPAALAQTSRPAAPPGTWEQTVASLAHCLVDPSDTEALGTVLPAGTSIRRFDRLDAEDRLSLRDLTVGAVVVAALAYPQTPDTLAADLSEHLRAAEFVPLPIRNEFVVEGEEPSNKANETAAQWVATTLQPGVEQLVGVIVLWQQKAPQSTSDPGTGQLIFVIVKARETFPRQYRLGQVIYGDTSQIVR